ncbi:DUF1801 domain-containing protein [Phaeobacter porticola]|uniref:YdhG-like domain-containing protein n=1 Tax=Phaeobacter porticola TaxID=1844006 RepID=A0A1L3IA18_9RHOB|nr:DUF1801 domain-containing protein [Phaeobacter porticola]APG48902.1 Domain protein of unknown function [Phaeobacter porticola]
MTPPFASAEIATVFDRVPPDAREGLLRLRRLIFEVAAQDPEVGEVTETLKWGQPSYTAAKAGLGTPLRLGCSKRARFALLVHCQSRVIDNFANRYPAWDKFDGTRAVLFDTPEEVEPLRHGWLIRHALTYHRDKTNLKPNRVEPGRFN